MLAPRGKLAFPSWGSASDLIASTSFIATVICSHLYPLYQIQGILVHRKDYMILICIAFLFVSFFHTRVSSTIYSSVSPIRDLFLPPPLSQELCSLMKDVLSSYTCILLQFGEAFNWMTGQFSPGLTILFKHAYNQCPQLCMRWIWFSWGRSLPKPSSSDRPFQQTQKHKIPINVTGKKNNSFLYYICISKKEELQIWNKTK